MHNFRRFSCNNNYIMTLKRGEKMKKISVILILSLLLTFGTNVIASAEEYAVEPRYNNSNYVRCNFIIEDDVAKVSVSVIGYQNVTSRISVNVKLEKRALLGLIWNDVEEWYKSSNNYYQNFEFSKAVGNGTYRCNFEDTVEGSGGSADVITDQKTVKN